jgi:hypothetical protein
MAADAAARFQRWNIDPNMTIPGTKAKYRGCQKNVPIGERFLAGKKEACESASRRPPLPFVGFCRGRRKTFRWGSVFWEQHLAGAFHENFLADLKNSMLSSGGTGFSGIKPGCSL